ncbi:hypothetical protein LUZ61_008961 [Rhynchospora tenuis]|uniref:Uncharacterized protein n=1 Tax=Rhynchospora tenuis TaxID=198213 RepID=A0AAD5ZWC3_9POAL|nr:hypothetical protein LUZ61_008961 [Rhynchospora tenuis]
MSKLSLHIIKHNLHLMESSISNSLNTAITTSEESSWTTYFEYFLASEEKKRGGAASSSLSFSDDKDDATGNSVVSDAASCGGELPLPSLVALSGACKNVKVKKRRVHGLLDEDPLEDTASSPVNSPKVSDMDQLELSPPNQVRPSRRDTRMVPKEAEILQALGGECTELKKRGLCLMPVSMLLDYVG